jgi:RHS repeat-associated protein
MGAGWEFLHTLTGDLRFYTDPSSLTNPSLGYNYIEFDPQGSVALIALDNGTVLGNCQTGSGPDLYGNNPSPASEEYNWQGQQGYRYGSGSGLYQVGYRAYDPQTGRFLQQDPMSEGAGDYTYSANSPANFTDPTGLESRHSKPVRRWQPRNREEEEAAWFADCDARYLIQILVSENDYRRCMRFPFLWPYCVYRETSRKTRARRDKDICYQKVQDRFDED